jgi:hypothetical protein
MPSLDEVATEYVRLAGLGDRSDRVFIDAIAAVQRQVRALEERDGRRAFLLAQLAALHRRARLLSGERLSVRSEAAALGLPVPTFDSARASSVRQALAAALPGRGSLLERLDSHRRAGVVRRAQLDATVTRLVAECRARTPPPGELLDGGVRFRYVIEKPWPAFTTDAGNGQSVVEIRRDVAWREEDLRLVLCHETYPGHHAQHLVWRDAAQRRGWIEFNVTPMFTPHAVMSERAAVTATGLAWPRESRSAVTRLLDDLAPLAAATAVDIVDGALDRQAGMKRLRDELLMPNGEEFIAFVERYRSMALAYVTPVADVRDWQSYVTLLRSPSRLVAGAKQ